MSSPVPGRSSLSDVGPEVGEELAAERPGEDAGGVEDAKAGEGGVHEVRTGGGAPHSLRRTGSVSIAAAGPPAEGGQFGPEAVKFGLGGPAGLGFGPASFGLGPAGLDPRR